MRFLTRTIIVLVTLSLTSASPTSAMTEMSQDKTVTISGSALLAGVTMTGLPGGPIITNQNGYYMAKVPRGFTGTARPIKEGYNFTPPSRVYSILTSDVTNEDYAPEIIQLLIRGNAGFVGVEMRGLPGNPTTGKDGHYQATVDYGWAGDVTPLKEGLTFEPPKLRYTRITTDQINQNYTPTTITYTISGNTGIGGVRMQGLPGTVFADQNGYYQAKLPYGWSGTVTPIKEGYSFEPASRAYVKVVADHTPENYGVKFDAGSSEPYGLLATSRSRARTGGPVSGVDPMMPDWPGSRSGRMSTGYPAPIGSAGRKALVIPSGEIMAEGLAETLEDMHVMSHILDERFKETRRIQGFFTDFGAFFGRDNRSTESIYLQGYGVLFLMEVNFAFSPPAPKQTQEPAETTEAVDSTWQKARQQVFSPGTSRGMDEDDSARDYDNQMVEELKKELVEALRHASNIRNVEPDEWVILTVIGGQRQSGMGFGSGMSGFGGPARGGRSSGGGMMGGGGSYGGGGGFVMGGYGGVGGMMGGGMGGMYSEMGTFGPAPVSSSTVLTIRAKKANVDEFAKGQSDLEQFQKFVQIFTY